MKTSKVKVVMSAFSGKISSIIGYTFGIFGFIGFLLELGQGADSVGLFIAFFFLAVGVSLIIKGIQIKRRIKRFKKYVFLISNQQINSIDSIATITKKPVDFVKKDLLTMINKRFFSNASISNKTNEIIIAGVMPQSTNQSGVEIYSCSGCGALGTKQIGIIKYCDYCGSPLS
ncbi:MAG: hypothetical protein LBC73_01950 [Oscillospiraceae bacterium]|jgi:hypothetical protein|nr:hypothetical protein [Oscillospiraceae bacterium]